MTELISTNRCVLPAMHEVMDRSEECFLLLHDLHAKKLQKYVKCEIIETVDFSVE